MTNAATGRVTTRPLQPARPHPVGRSGPNATIQPTSNAPVEIRVEVWFDSCSTTGTTTVQPNNGGGGGTPPAISFGDTAVCPTGSTYAHVPLDYSSYSWSIVNGVLESPATNSYVYFRANGAGPVQLSVSVSTPDSCGLVATGSLPLRSADPPVIRFQNPDVCPNGPGAAWSDTQWDGG